MRRALGLLAAIVLLTGWQLSDPEPASAACATHWQSRTEPPEEILVLRTATGKVEKVGLRHYVAVVMASGEWPTSLPPAVLEAGAQAVKQYAWYYALAGNHRDGYRNASGRCYDVRDDSQDQVYRPETAEPTDKQKAARDALWGLSLHKNGEFLLTGYRAGSAEKCAQDADGWHLYTHSARDCAKRLDYDGQRILRAYYEPKLEFEWADGTAPPDDEELAVPSGAPDPTGSQSPGPTGAEADKDSADRIGRRGIFGWLSDAFDERSDGDE